MLLFRIAAGETWVDGIDVTDEDGNVNWSLGGYILSFIAIVNWTLLARILKSALSLSLDLYSTADVPGTDF